MKATLDIPDELYRRVKARSALEGRPVRAVAVQLFQSWLAAAPPLATASEVLTPTEINDAPWLAITRRHLRPDMRHDMNAIRAAIARGWAAEADEKMAAAKLARPS